MADEPLTVSYRSDPIDLLAELNDRVKKLIRREGKFLYQGELPEQIVRRVMRTDPYNLGFTGFKSDPADTNGYFHHGLSGELLLAVCSHGGPVWGGPDPDWRFYAAVIPFGAVVRYYPGDVFPPAPLDKAIKVINAPDNLLLSALRDGVQRLCAFVIESEKDRMPDNLSDVAVVEK